VPRGEVKVGSNRRGACRPVRSTARPFCDEGAPRASKPGIDKPRTRTGRRGDEYEDRGYVFANETGGHLHPNVLYRRYNALIDRAGVPVIRFHDLRHTSATLLLAGGVHGKIVQERLGHANIAMTLDLYSHVTADMQRNAADALEKVIASVEQRTA
jgi:integrase